MEAKINDTKEFAIGTKIEYNGKLYEVVEQKFCDKCSLNNICPNNDVSKNDSYNLLSRDERIKIFGECSPIKRIDNKSVVFKEIHKDIPEINNIIIRPLYVCNIMGDEDIYIGNVRNYYNTQSIILSANERPGLKACSSSFPDGKTQRRESRRRAIRRRKGRL